MKQKEPKPKKCKYCKGSFTPFRSTQVACGPQCAMELAKIQEEKKNRDRNKVSEAMAKLEKKLKKEEYDAKFKKLSAYEAEAKEVFQRWIRFRDEKENCISCGTPVSSIWDGGHYKKAELFSGTIFHPDNCHKQCRKCNFYMNGNESDYRIGLSHRIGPDRLKVIEDLAQESRYYKWTKDELIEIKRKFQDLLRKKQKVID